MKLFEILNIEFDMDVDFSHVEVLSGEEVVIELSVMRPDYVFKIDDVIFMMEFESSHVGTKKKKLFKLYVAAHDYKNNDENNKIVFFVISTNEKSKMANYSINDWDSFNFLILSLKDLDKKKIINNIEFSDKELLGLGLTPILESGKDNVVKQFFEIVNLMSKIRYPNEEIKYSVYGLVLMLSSMYFDELDPVRKKIQGDLMGKVDCVMEACQESFDDGFSKGVKDNSIQFIKGMLEKNISLEDISEITGLSLDEINDLIGS